MAACVGLVLKDGLHEIDEVVDGPKRVDWYNVTSCDFFSKQLL